MSSDEEVICVKKKKGVVADSSDENEALNKADVKLEDKDSDHEESEGSNRPKYEKSIKKKQCRITTFDSSSDSEDDTSKSQNKKSLKKSKSKFSFENNIKSDDGSSSEDEGSENTVRDENVEPSNLGSRPVFQNQWYKNTDLYDAEGSSGEDVEKEKSTATSENESNDPSIASAILEESSKRKNSKNHQKEPLKRQERKSKKKAQEDIKTDIHRESQRLMRQAPISIPYHRPKQRSLAEFLVRRKSTPKVSLQASSELLVTALREIEQREKEVELFYKSESSEDDSEIKTEEKKFVTNAADQGFDKDTKVMQSSEQTLDYDASIHKDNQETDNVKQSNTNETEKSDCEDNIVSSCTSQSGNATEGDPLMTNENTDKTGNSENENLLNNHIQVDNLNHTKELKIIADESSYISSEINTDIIENIPDNLELTSKSPEINLEEKTDNHERSNLGNSNPFRPAEQSQIKIDNDLSLNSNISSRSISISLNLVNTEEFSLKLSESQSELEPVENISSQNPLHGKSEENLDSNTTKHIVNKIDILEARDDKTAEENHTQDNTEEEAQESRKLELSCEESNEEKELFKKYNVDVKNKTDSIPKINGSHDEVIDLDDGIPKPEVNQLMKRFLTHLSYKKKPKKKVAVELSVVSAERDAEGQVSAISEESLRVVVGEEEEGEEDPSLARPGAKLTRLRQQLQQQMEQQREREWAKRQQEQRLYEDEEVYEGEKDVCDELEEELEKSSNAENKDETEEEEEDEEEEEEESENEDEETDEEVAEKKRKSRSAFLDDEAEESDEEPFARNNRKIKENNIDNEDIDDNVDDCNESTVDIDLNDKDEEKDEEINDKSSVKKENTTATGSKTISDFFIKRPVKLKPCLPRTRTASDMFESEDILTNTPDEEELPSFQKPRSLDDKEDVEDKPLETPPIISPAFQLTGLENMDLTNKYNWSAPSTPCKDFFSPKTVTPVRAIPNLVDKSPLVGTQDLENMCSGNFSSQPLQEMEDAQDFDLFLAEDSQLSRDQVTPLKYSSAGQMNSHQKHLKTLPADDEDEPAAKVPTKKAKKLNFSDDEDDGDENLETREEADGDASAEEGSDVEGDAGGEVEYDSEENEVEAGRGAAAGVGAGEFLDVEAELSEEEWSSEDEDERGLDALETEEADRENIDQRRLKRELDQIHMKEMLKEDKRQVKLLQEMLLEDGELHSENKRQRLFRWSNSAAFEEGDNKAVLDSDEEKGEDDEDEENWRKSRHERELFLQEHSKKTEKLETLELEDSDSQLLKLGQKALKRLNSSSQEPKLTPPTLSNPLASPDTKKTFALPKRGSFLSRGQQTLRRLAQMVSSSSEGPIQQPKNSRNFVFASISPTKSEQEEAKSSVVPNKRKTPHFPLPIAKKPCVPKSMTVNKDSLFDALSRGHS